MSSFFLPASTSFAKLPFKSRKRHDTRIFPFPTPYRVRNALHDLMPPNENKNAYRIQEVECCSS